MSTLVRLWTSPARLLWWDWGKILGATALAGLVVALAMGYVPSPAVMAAVLHLAADFTFQSAETSARKGERGWHLVVHSLVAGGLPLALSGLLAGHLAAVLPWTAAGAAIHFAVDWTRKFGLRSLPLAVGLDQACHLAVILALTL